MDRTWDLSPLYNSVTEEAFLNDLESMRLYVKDLIIWTEKAFVDIDNYTEKLEKYIQKQVDFVKFTSLLSFASLSYATNTEDEEVAKAMDQIRAIYSETAVSEALFKAFVPKGDVEKAIKESALLEEHAFFLREINDTFQYVLPEREELILSRLSNTGSYAFDNLVSVLTSTVFEEVEINGVKEKKTLTQLRNLAYDGNKTTRKNAFEAEMKAYEKIDKSVAAALSAIKGEALTVVSLRGYESVLDMTLKQSRMSKKTLDALLTSMKNALPHLRKYYLKKGEMLGYEKGLPYFEKYAPLGEVEMTFTYDEAADFIVKNFNDFSVEMGDFARHAFDNNWLDPFPKPGKSGGAFCAGVRSIMESRILSNFSGSYSDMTTLAHELGHGWHNVQLFKESVLNGRAPMPVAETASNFCETIVEQAALKAASDEEKVVILDNSITGMVEVIVDIYSRFLFEDEVIRRRKNGPLSVEELNNIMIAAQEESYGEGLSDSHKYMWACKSHYYSANRNYYNFPYAYGMLFARGLYAKFEQEGPSFVEDYNKLLQATGKNTLEDIGKLAGVDVSSTDFWDTSLQSVKDMIDEFCAL